MLLGLGGCAKPVEERTAREKRVLAKHLAKLNTAKMQKDDPFWQKAWSQIESQKDQPAHVAVDRRRPWTLVRGLHTSKTILLTFDDGPHPASTPRLLKVLGDEHVPATFFVIGKMAKKRPDLVRAIQLAGQTIGNHTYSHVTLTRLTADEIRTEYRANDLIVQSITGQKMQFCRPPGGDYDVRALRAAQEEGLTTVLWTDDPGDFANPGDGIVLDRTLKRLSNGGVILLHDGSPNTLDVLKELIHEARARGFAFTTPQAMVADLDRAAKSRLTAMRLRADATP